MYSQYVQNASNATSDETSSLRGRGSFTINKAPRASECLNHILANITVCALLNQICCQFASDRCLHCLVLAA